MNKQVKQLITVLSAAVFGGFLLAFLMLMFYGPSGEYVAGQTILSPVVIEKISFKDIHPKTQKHVEFVFDHTEFVYFDYLRGSWTQKEISSEAYSKFYNLVSSDKSFNETNQEVQEFFLKTSPLALVTSVRTEVSPTVKIFQVIQFTKEGYYRVKLHEQEEKNEWAYFYHSGLYPKIMNLFSSDPPA